MVTQHAKNQIWAYVDQITGLGLKLGVPILIVSAGYLLHMILGDNVRSMDKMNRAELDYLIRSIDVAIDVLKWSGVAVVFSIVLRLFSEEVTGQGLSLAGALLYFGSPVLFSNLVDPVVMKHGNVVGSIVGSFSALGAICLVPGVVLVLRDCILRIWRGMSVKRVLEYRWGDEEERQKKYKRRSLLPACWNMAYCRPFIRDVCPAFRAKKSCWRIKVGCYCDEETILRAMAGKGTDNEHYRGIMKSLGLDKRMQNRLSAKIKRARCRRCMIYSEHQRLKYRVLSPMVFPSVGLAFYLFYGEVAGWVGLAMEKADRFMNFMASSSLSASSSDTDGRIMTTAAIIWLAIIAVSYSLRALEYLIFDLQV